MLAQVSIRIAVHTEVFAIKNQYLFHSFNWQRYFHITYMTYNTEQICHMCSFTLNKVLRFLKIHSEIEWVYFWQLL